jgi:hypothetical protein
LSFYELFKSFKNENFCSIFKTEFRKEIEIKLSENNNLKNNLTELLEKQLYESKYYLNQ